MVGLEPARRREHGELTGCPNPAEGDWNSITLNGTPSAEVDDTDGTVLISVNDANWRALEQGGWEIVLTTAMKNRNSIDRQHTQDYYANIVVAERPFYPTCFHTPREEYTAPERVADGHVGFAVSCPPDGSMDLELRAQPSGDRTQLHLTAETTPGDCLPDSR